jgi:hypothetical protein
MKRLEAALTKITPPQSRKMGISGFLVSLTEKNPSSQFV